MMNEIFRNPCRPDAEPEQGALPDGRRWRPAVEAQEVPLDLAYAPPILYLFGIAGVGKTFIGQLITSRSDYRAYDADIDFSPEMHRTIREGRAFTDEMRQEYYAHVARRILELRQDAPRLVVMQGTYKQWCRDIITDAVRDAELVHVVADPKLVEERLIRRGNQISPGYAAMILKIFEDPVGRYKELFNNESAREVILQLNRFYGRS